MNATPHLRPRGLREAHCHLAQLGRSMAMLDLAGCADASEALDRLATHPPERSGWVLAHGARPEAWPERRLPTRAELDRALGPRPSCLWCFDYHALATNSAGLTAAGLTAASRFEGGHVGLDDAGEPTGTLLERAALALWAAVPEPDAREQRSQVLAACAHLASLGFAEAHDLKAQPRLGPLLADLRAAGETSLSFQLFPLIDDLAEAAATRHGWESDSLRLGGAKVFVDGTLNSRTAWVLEQWLDADRHPAHPRGVPMLSAAQLDWAFAHAGSHALPIAAHAIGDGAVRAVLDAVERAQGPAFTPPPERPHRIEHAELIHPEDIPRFAALGVTCSVQPCHLLYDIEALRRGAGDRLDRVLPLRGLIASGLEPGKTLLFGSDAPIVRAAPEDSVRAAVDRRREGMAWAEAIGHTQALSENEAWACFASPGA